MSEKRLYRDYFNIDPKYYAAVTADLIREGKVDWKSFYPHETFVKLLERTHSVLSGKEPLSLWVEGAYGTGKSHAVLTVKSLLEASDEEVETYFKDYDLDDDLCQKLITDKNSGKLIIIHRIGSAGIKSDLDLIIAVQQSIMMALKENGIKNQAEASMKEAFINWLNKTGTKVYFNTLISQEKYAWNFGGLHADDIVDRLNNGTDMQVESLMHDVMSVLKEAGVNIYGDINDLANWIKDIIKANNISAILFIWDEFTEFFINNPNTLTGFQTLAEISLSQPFYFMIVSHESSALFNNKETANKILGRFVPPIKIELPDNMAFRLMAQAMKKTSDPVLSQEWAEYSDELNGDLKGVRYKIATSTKRSSAKGRKIGISDKELQSIVPIHPYAALMLKHLSVAFSSNQRSMFDFIISNDMTDAKGFKWFINNYGPVEDIYLLTIDMLWNFFSGKGQKGLSDDVRIILDSYDLLQTDRLSMDEQRVFKTILLLEAISTRVSDVALLRPNQENVDLAFSGTSWPSGKGLSIAEKLCNDGLLFKRSVGGSKMEYTVANNTGDTAAIEKLKRIIRSDTQTQDLVMNAELMDAVQLPEVIKERFVKAGATADKFHIVVRNMNNKSCPERFKTVVTFARNDDEADRLKALISKEINSPQNELIFIDTGSNTMGNDLYDTYVENMAYSKYYAKNDKARADGFEKQANRCLIEWKQKINNGAFMVYDEYNKSGERCANLNWLQEKLAMLNHHIYYYGLEQFDLNDIMFRKYQLSNGAKFGLAQTTSGAYHTSNREKSLENALKDAWKVEHYWEDPTKRGLPIVQIKLKVNRIIEEGFEKNAGRISMSSIYEALERKPFGFLPCSVSAFVMGFVMKEYATSDYFWSNGSTSEPMTVEKMKLMIGETINQKITPRRNYKEEYIVTMSPEQKAFLDCTAKVFRISPTNCGSVESARDQMRVKMTELSFPIWCVKYILDDVQLESSADLLKQVIDAYCSVANTANGGKATESDLAERIGRLVYGNQAIIADLERLLVDDYCTDGMRVYIESFQNGILPKLGMQIGDNGEYLYQVQQRFNDDANWVWNPATVDEKIEDVILEYRIIVESNKSLAICKSMQDVVTEWKKRTNNIRISHEVLSKSVGDLGPFLEQLYYMKQSGSLQDQNKEKFYDLLIAQREAFERFYKDQVTYFKKVVEVFLEDLKDSEIEKLYGDFETGQFTKSSTSYYKYVENAVKVFFKNQASKKLKVIWMEKAHTKDPADWSVKYSTPILCMFDDAERSTARSMFDVMLQSVPDEGEVNKAIDYLNNADFFERLDDSAERDHCFMERVVGEFAVMIPNADTARDELMAHIYDRPYDWMDNQAVHNQLKKVADKQYKISGCEKAWAIIEKMNPTELRHYLRELISENLMVGMEILRNK